MCGEESVTGYFLADISWGKEKEYLSLTSYKDSLRKNQTKTNTAILQHLDFYIHTVNRFRFFHPLPLTRGTVSWEVNPHTQHDPTNTAESVQALLLVLLPAASKWIKSITINRRTTGMEVVFFQIYSCYSASEDPCIRVNLTGRPLWKCYIYEHKCTYMYTHAPMYRHCAQSPGTVNMARCYTFAYHAQCHSHSCQKSTFLIYKLQRWTSAIFNEIWWMLLLASELQKLIFKQQ